MADGYIEKRQQDYEARKEAWLRKKRHLPAQKRLPPKPEALD